MAMCADLAGSELSYPFNENAAVYKVGAKMFAVVSEGDVPARLTVKCDPDHAASLMQEFKDIEPGYHMNKRHWITAALTSSLPAAVVEEIITDSYELVVATLSQRVRTVLEADT
jgi:predicted DNA-binding protein (MmcQ/YjbR family)